MVEFVCVSTGLVDEESGIEIGAVWTGESEESIGHRTGRSPLAPLPIKAPDCDGRFPRSPLPCGQSEGNVHEARNERHTSPITRE